MNPIKKALVSLTLLGTLVSGAYAQTCYDPNAGYFQCRPVSYVHTCYDPNYGYYNCRVTQTRTYYRDDSGANFAAGAMFGLVGGAIMASAFQGGHRWGNHWGHGGWHHRW